MNADKYVSYSRQQFKSNLETLPKPCKVTRENLP